jgi:hypothetical protein
MIAIGSHGQPSVIQLQARMIRFYCGESIPILVSDDKTEEAHHEGDEDRGKRLKERLLEICDQEGLIYKDCAETRMGHCAGDLGPFYHGLIEAVNKNSTHLCKLSQRFIFAIPDWFNKATRVMKSRKRSLSSRQCKYGSNWHFHLRTECVFLNVEKWIPHINDLKPKSIPCATEDYLFRIHQRFDEPILGCPLFKEDREKIEEGVLWKDTLPPEETEARYRQYAKRFGVVLGEEFSTTHSSLLPGYKLW